MQPLTSIFKKDVRLSTTLGKEHLNNTERRNLQLMQNRHSTNSCEQFVFDLSGATPHGMRGRSPCLTRTRAASNGFWLSWLERKMSTREILALQGVSLNNVAGYESCMTERQPQPLQAMPYLFRSLPECCKCCFIPQGARKTLRVCALVH